MGRAPCCDKANVKKGPWSPEEDAKLKEFIEKYGTGGNWIALPLKAGLKRCGKSCRLRWLNYLRPNIKHGEFSDEEDKVICTLYASIGSRWSIIAAQLPGRTDNDIKNYWNTKLKKKLMGAIASGQGRYSLPFPGTIQTPLTQSQPLSSLSQLYDPIYTPANNKTLTAIQPVSAPQNILYSNSNDLPFLTGQYSHNYQPNQEGGLLDFPYYPVKDNMLVFGGNDQASCSSSDGSCGQIRYGGDHAIKQEEMACLQGLISNRVEENQKFMLQCHGKNIISGDQVDPLDLFLLDQKPNGMLLPDNSRLQYDLEEVKQLVTPGNNGCNSNFLFNGESKTHERGAYYY